MRSRPRSATRIAPIAVLAERGFAPAAFFIDTAITSSGIFDPPPAWAAAVTARVRAAGGLIVADEVQYGLGRCGSHFWGFERRGLEPDIVTLGKPVANGYPMGVVVANRALIEAFQAKFGFFSTFGGNAVAAAAGLAVLEVLEREQLMANAAEHRRVSARRLECVAAGIRAWERCAAPACCWASKSWERGGYAAAARQAHHQRAGLRVAHADRLRGPASQHAQAAAADAVSARARRPAGRGHRRGGDGGR